MRGASTDEVPEPPSDPMVRTAAAGIKPLGETSSRLQPNVGPSLGEREGRFDPGGGPNRDQFARLTFAKGEFTVFTGGEVVERIESPTTRSRTSAACPRSA